MHVVYHKTNAVELLYDTGAETTLMSWEVAKQLWLIRVEKLHLVTLSVLSYCHNLGYTEWLPMSYLPI